MTDVKFRMKLGALEFECEASEAFVESQLIDIMERLLRLEVPDIVTSGSAAEATGTALVPSAKLGETLTRLSTTDFAVKMGAKSGSDLVMAAAAYLHHTRGMEDFRRADLLNEMKGSKAFYRASYGSNLSKSLEILTKSGRLQNPRADTFTLPYAEIENTKRLL